MEGERSLPVEVAARVDRAVAGGMHGLARHQAEEAQAGRVNMAVRAHLGPAIQLLLHHAAGWPAPTRLAHQQGRPARTEGSELAYDTGTSLLVRRY